MSATGLPIFDRTVHETNELLAAVRDRLGLDDTEAGRQEAYHALRAVLVTLRDRIPVNLAAALSAQLPTLARGVFYEGFTPAEQPHTYRAQGEFFQRVEAFTTDGYELDGEAATRAVLAALSEAITPGLNDKVRAAVPEDVRAVWPATSEQNYAGA